MDIRYLKYFISVAKHLNFTKAAQECFISQTAMSQHISKMEDELGFKLFYRNNRMVELTAGGKVFLDEAISLTKRYDHAVFWGSVASMDYKGCLRVGFLSYNEKRFLPRILEIFHKRNPNVEIHLSRGSLMDNFDALCDDKLDVIMSYPHDIMEKPNVAVKKFAFKNLWLVVNKKHPLAKYESVSVEMFQDEPFLFIDEEKIPQLYTSAIQTCNTMGFEPTVAAVSADVDSLLLMVEIGLGVTLLPSSSRSNLDESLVALKVENASMERSEHSIVYLTTNPNPSLEVFLKIVDELEKEGQLTL